MRRPLRVVMLAVIAGLPLLLVAAADLPIVPTAEARLEDRARTATRAASVKAEIGAFPVVGRALALGELASIDFMWLGVKVGVLQATSLRLHLDGVGLDRRELLGGETRITGVEAGDVRMVIAVSQLSQLFDGAVTAENGRVRLRLAEVSIDVEVSATSQGLVLAPGGIAPVTLAFGTEDIPCAPTVDLEEQNLVLECSFRGLPPILRGRLTAA